MNNPIKPTLKTEFVPLLLIIISLIASLYFFSLFPDQVATHWNAQGNPDGYSGRAFAAFFFPLLNLAIYLLMLFIPHLDPKKSNYKKFTKIYHLIKGALVIFLSLMYFVVGLNGLGYDLPVAFFVSFGIGFLFIVIGYYLKNIKPNWFMGIRTPWTLSSDHVWKETHKYGSKAFMLSGLLIILAAFFPDYFLYFIVLLILLILSTIVYSYVIYKK